MIHKTRMILTGILLILTVSLRLFAQTPVGTEIENVAFAQYRDAGGFVYSIQSQPVITTLSQGYVLTISKDVEKTVFLPLDTVVYHITLANSGNFAASSITVTDTLSADLNYFSSQPSATVNGRTISWDLLTLQPGTVNEISLTCIVAPGVFSGTTIENSAAFQTPEGVTGNSPPVEITIGSQPDLLIEKVVNRLNAAVGDTLIYTITLQNVGNAATNNTILYDDLPDQTEFVICSGNGQNGLGIITWNIDVLPPGTTVEETVTAIVKTNVPSGTTVTNLVSIVNSEGINRSAEASTLITEEVSQPDLWIEKSTDINASPGDTLVYRIVFGNQGNGAGTGIIISDSLSPDLEFLSASGTHQYESPAHRVVWNRSDLNSGNRDSVDISVRIRPGIADGSQVQNTAKIVCNEGESAATEATVTVLSPALSITKTAASPVVSAGNELKYTITYQNTGNGPARNVIISDTLSADVDYVSSTGSSVYDSNDRIVTWNIDNLEANMSSSQSLELTVRVKSPLNNGTMIANSALITCSEGFLNKSSVTITVESAAVLSLTKTTASKAFPGDTLVYQIAFTNTGNSIALQTSITDTLSSQLEFINASGVYVYDLSQHSLKWDIGELSPGVDSSLSLQVRIKSSLTGINEVTNMVWIHSQGNSVSSNIAQTTVKSLNLHIVADPDSIIGNGFSYSNISATITDASGQAVADGTPVIFSTSLGSFSPGTDTVLTMNGIAATRLNSSLIDRDYVPVKVKAEMLKTSGASVSDSTTVVFYTVTIVGIVTDSDNTPVPNAIVTIIQNGVVIGVDTTSADGQYSIPVFGPGQYTIIIQFVDPDGNTRIIEYVVEIVISEIEEMKIIPNKCGISGRIIDSISRQPINEADIPVIIKSVTPSPFAKAMQTTFSDTVLTDTSGFWSFNGLDLGTYSLEIMPASMDNYHTEARLIVIDIPGQYMMNADIYLQQIPFRTYKTVDKSQVLTGDTLTYRIYYETLEYAVTDTVRIVDRLPSELEWIPSSLNHAAELILDGFDAITNELRFHRFGMPANQTDSIIFKARVKNDLMSGVATITNQASVFNRSDTVLTADDVRSSAVTRIISPFLAVKKAVNRRVVETGDILTYTVTFENRSNDMALNNLVITDILPPGFRYRENRSVWNGHSISDPSMMIPGNRQTLVWTIADTLYPGSSCKLKYRVIIGLDSRLGKNENLASAIATMPNGFSLPSNIAGAEVIIKPGVIHERGFIFGKVFYDLNGNNLHDQNEETVKGVEIITEDGIRVVTDEYGKYSIPNARSGDHVLRINRRTLPDNSYVRLASSDFLGDATSRLVKVTPSGIAKANFILEKPLILPPRSEPVNISLTQTRKQIDTVFLDVNQMALTKSLRILVYKPWSLTLRLGFSSGKAILVPQNESSLEKIVEFLKWQKHISVEINGHTDNLPLTADAQFKNNKDLSRARSEAVLNYLKQHGIQAERMEAKGFGDIKPLMSNISAEGRKTNRRVEIIFHTPEELRPYGSNLKFQADFRYSGTLPLENVRFINQLPDGFRFEDKTGEFDNVSISREKIDDKKVQWNLGDWPTPAHHRLNYSLIPFNHRLVQSNSSVNSVLEFETPDGQINQTRILKNTINTHIEEVLFKVILEGALFDVGSWNLKLGVLPSLNKIGTFMTWQTQMTITVEGFTDSIGSQVKNQKLSIDRANAVKNYLTKNYLIKPDRIYTKGYGENFPIADNKTKAGRMLNRRVEVIANSDFSQKMNFDIIILSDSLQHRLEKTTTLIDSLSADGSWTIPSAAITRPRLTFQFANPPIGKLIRVTASLSADLFFPNAVTDSLKHIQTWSIPIQADQRNFVLEMEIGSTPAMQNDQTIRFHIETIDEKMTVKSSVDKTITVRLKSP